MISVIVLNGGSSSGKSTIARCLQARLPDPWLSISVDTMVDAMPQGGVGIDFAPDGGVTVGPAFHAIEEAWMAGVAAMVRAGVRVIIDDVFLGGASSQRRWETALAGLPVLWVGVRCDGDVAAARENARGDRVSGMARTQASLAHNGVRYDVEVDTTRGEPIDCARAIVARLR